MSSTKSETPKQSTPAPANAAKGSDQVITLSLNSLEVKDKKKHWHLYFTVITNHPTDASKLLVGVFPANGEEIQLKPESNNQYSFVPQGGKAGDGIELLSLTNPSILEMDVQLYVKNKGELARSVDLISELTKGLNAQAFEVLPGFLGKVANWVSMEASALGQVIKVIEGLPDRSMGMIDMGQNLSALNSSDALKTYSNVTTTGEVEFNWTWQLLG